MSRCEPGSGNTYLAIGQDLFSIDEYVTSQYNHSLHNSRLKPKKEFAPAAAMVYTDLHTLEGLFRPTDYGSGIEYADGILDSLFPDSSVGLQIGLWLNGTYGCEKILNDEREYQLKMLASYLDVTKAGAVFLRVGYEFDNPSFGYSDDPEKYIGAYQKLVTFLRSEMEEDALARTFFVWHSWAAPRVHDLTLNDFYPGDDFVDWIGISVFQQLFPWESGWWGEGHVDLGGNRRNIEEVLEFAVEQDKPTMIAESAPFGGVNMNNTKTIKNDDTDPWNRWFRRVIDLIEEYDIDMFSYINCDWESQPMWHKKGFGDTRLSVNKEVMDKWNRMIIGNEGRQNFLMGGELTCAADKESFHTELDKNFERSDYISYIVLSVLLAALIVLSRIYSRPKPEIKTSEQKPLTPKRRSSTSQKSVASYHSVKSGYSMTGFETPAETPLPPNPSTRPTLMMQEYMNLSGASLTGRISSVSSVRSVQSMHRRSASNPTIRMRVDSAPLMAGPVQSNHSIYSGKTTIQSMNGLVQPNSSLHGRSHPFYSANLIDDQYDDEKMMST